MKKFLYAVLALTVLTLTISCGSLGVCIQRCIMTPTPTPTVQNPTPTPTPTSVPVVPTPSPTPLPTETPIPTSTVPTSTPAPQGSPTPSHCPQADGMGSSCLNGGQGYTCQGGVCFDLDSTKKFNVNGAPLPCDCDHKQNCNRNDPKIPACNDGSPAPACDNINSLPTWKVSGPGIDTSRSFQNGYGYHLVGTSGNWSGVVCWPSPPIFDTMGVEIPTSGGTGACSTLLGSFNVGSTCSHP